MALLGEHLQKPTYEILNPVGEGAQGECVLAYHHLFKRMVVQKTVGTLGQSDSAIRTCEPEVLRDLKHDRIVQLYEAQWDPSPEWQAVKGVTFVMPYYEERSAYDALTARRRFRLSDAVQISCDVLSALDFIHRTGLVHRDVKPANVLLEHNFTRAVLTDLGSAAYVRAAVGGAPLAGCTPLYQAPEAGPTNRLTPSADVYAAGLVLVELLNGAFPYESIDFDQVDARLAAGRRALADTMLEPAFWIPKALATVIRAMCAKDPLRRPGSAAEAIRALQGVRFVDWRHDEGNGLTGTWSGYWPPTAQRRDQRITRVTIGQLDRGRNAGRLSAKTEWTQRNGKWRAYRALTKTLDDDRSTVDRYFKEVERRAQAAPSS